MKKLFALAIAATLGLSSAAFAADSATAPATTAPASTAPAKAHHKAMHKHKKAAEQQAQATRKHHKTAVQKPTAQKAQAAKKHTRKALKPAAK